MQAKWRGPYRGGEIELESGDLEELDKNIDEVETKVKTIQADEPLFSLDVPKLTGNLGPSEAVRQVLATVWGRKEPRTMAELQQLFETNALFFSTGTLSGVLTYLTKVGQLRRLEKAGKWSYTLSQ